MSASNSSAPKSLTREGAMELLRASGKYTDAKLAKLEKMDDEDFEDMIMPLATSLMKKTKAPAKVLLSEEEKAELVRVAKMEWLASLSHKPEGEDEAVRSYMSAAKYMGLTIPIPSSIVFYTKEELDAMGKVEKRKLTDFPMDKTKKIKVEETDMEAYTAFIQKYKILQIQIQNAAYGLLANAYKPNKFQIGNMKKNANGKIEKMGGKSAKTDDELVGEIDMVAANGTTKKMILQKNDEDTNKCSIKNDTGKNLFRVKNVGSGSNQTAILPYTTPYEPSEIRDGGCGCIVFNKDVAEFMVEKISDTKYKKISTADAIKCMPCFRVCNRKVSADGRCGTHLRHTEPSKKILGFAEQVDFEYADDGMWSASNTEWYENF